MNDKTIGWLIVGCSDIVTRRAGAAIRDQAQSRIVAVHSRDATRARAVAGQFGAGYATDDLPKVLADPRIQVAYIATEVDRHRELTIAALRAGKHVLVEKPMALDAAECREMIEAARTAQRHLAVAYYAHFLPKTQIMKRIIDEGRLGKIVRAVVRNIGWYNPPPTDPKYWRVTERAGGNMLADVGSHRLDLLCYFIGRPTKVIGMADHLSHSYPACDTETALVQFENGAHVIAMANANVRHAGKLPTSIEIYGTEGALLTDPWNDEPVSVIGSDAPPIPVTIAPNAHFPIVDDFASSIASGRAPRFNGTDGYWATAIISGAYESARTGKVAVIS
jgi:predicted dehydrogenase